MAADRLSKRAQLAHTALGNIVKSHVETPSIVQKYLADLNAAYPRFNTPAERSAFLARNRWTLAFSRIVQLLYEEVAGDFLQAIRRDELLIPAKEQLRATKKRLGDSFFEEPYATYHFAHSTHVMRAFDRLWERREEPDHPFGVAYTEQQKAGLENLEHVAARTAAVVKRGEKLGKAMNAAAVRAGLTRMYGFSAPHELIAVMRNTGNIPYVLMLPQVTNSASATRNLNPTQRVLSELDALGRISQLYLREQEQIFALPSVLDRTARVGQQEIVEKVAGKWLGSGKIAAIPPGALREGRGRCAAATPLPPSPAVTEFYQAAGAKHGLILPESTSPQWRAADVLVSSGALIADELKGFYPQRPGSFAAKYAGVPKTA